MKIIVNQLPVLCKDCLFYRRIEVNGYPFYGCFLSKKTFYRVHKKENEKIERSSDCPLATEISRD